MSGGHVGVPAPYLDVESTAFELTTSGQVSRLLWATGRLVAYCRRHRLRRHDLKATPFELGSRLCREGIWNGDTSRASSIWMKK